MKISFVWHTTSVDDQQKHKTEKDIIKDINSEHVGVKMPTETIFIAIGEDAPSQKLHGVATNTKKEILFTFTYSLLGGQQASYAPKLI